MSEVPPTPEPQETPAEQPAAAAAEPTAAPADPTPPTDQPASPYAQAPSYSGPTQDEKMWAMLAWFLSILSGFVAPLIFFLISNDKPFAKRHAAMALGVHIFGFIGYIIGVALAAVLIGFLVLPVVGIFVLVVTIMGGVAANKGETYEPPIIGPMIAKMFNV